MNRFTRPVCLLILLLVSLVALPVGAFAAQVATETVTIQVNVTTPDGTSVIGTVVAHRQATTPVTAALTFTGMLNGVPTRAEATATEEWSSDGQAHIVITDLRKASGAPLTGLISYSKGAAVLAAPLSRDVDVILTQLNPNLISVNGVPLAIDGLMTKPFALGGRTAYVVTMPGQGSSPISVLPRTGAGNLFLDPLLIVGLLVVSGLGLVGLSSRMRQGGPRAVVKH
jgi:hypothetical protein